MARIKQVKYTFESIVIAQLALVGVLVGTLLSSVFIPDSTTSENNAGYWLLATLLVSMSVFTGYGIWVYSHTKNWIKRRNTALATYALTNKFIYHPSVLSAAQYVSPTLFSFGVRDQWFNNMVKGDKWTFGDYNFAIYRKTKNGEYKEKTIYYSVLSIDLPRALPNVFFDSKATRGKEFRKLFDDSQLHSLEGNFDTYFDTYFPTFYTIDSLSFITPEVMESLMQARHYDIEIYENKLYLYQPLKHMPQQIEDVLAQGNNVYNTLMNNIKTYRDERLDFAKGRQGVSVAGIRLRRGLLRSYFAIFFGSLLLMSGIAVLVKIPDSRMTMVPYVPMSLGLALTLGHIKIINNELAYRKIAEFAHKNSKYR